MKFVTFFENYNSMNTSRYYEELDKHLKSFGYRLGENLSNPALGWANPEETGIYEGDTQIGKINLLIDGGILYLENIRSYGKHFKRNFGLIEKIYPFHREQAIKYSLIVKSELVNPKTDTLFNKIFSNGFSITNEDGTTSAVPNI